VSFRVHPWQDLPCFMRIYLDLFRASVIDGGSIE